MKAESLQRLERAELLGVRWICGLSLKDRKLGENFLRRRNVHNEISTIFWVFRV